MSQREKKGKESEKEISKKRKKNEKEKDIKKERTKRKQKSVKNTIEQYVSYDDIKMYIFINKKI